MNILRYFRLSDHCSRRVILRAKLGKKLGWKTRPCSAEDANQIFARRGDLGFQLAITASAENPIPEHVLKNYLNHSFALLGQDWKVYANENSRTELPEFQRFSLENQGNSNSYQPLNWAENHGSNPGEDIKLPWELARLQHLPQLGWYALTKRADPEIVKRLGSEFRSVVGDFHLQNPVSQGNNWRCTMDVAIRIANILVAHDLFLEAGLEESDSFQRLLIKITLEHGRFIFQNLEWYREGSGNHYLANLAGLVFCSLWLPNSRETDQWLRFAQVELCKEAKRQFLPDGGNFEGSVFYHRLSLEIVAYAYFALQGAGIRKNRKILPLLEIEKVLTAGFPFLRDCLDDLGHGIQIGDNDSGRFLKLSPEFFSIEHSNLSGLEDCLNAHDTLSLGNLIGMEQETQTSDFQFAEALLGKMPFPKQASRAENSQHKSKKILPPENVIQHVIPIVATDPSPWETGSYPDFGLFFWKKNGISIWIRCGTPSGDGHGAHAHFDQLHLEIHQGKKYLTFDPGSLCYTGDITTRNFFRGPESHFIPRLPEFEHLANQAVDTFRYPGLPKGECLYFDENEFLGTYALGAGRVFRKAVLENDKVTIWDWSESSAIMSQLPCSREVSWGYGRRVLREALLKGEI